jgi:hypothetical protein
MTLSSISRLDLSATFLVPPVAKGKVVRSLYPQPSDLASRHSALHKRGALVFVLFLF